jgi:hypothetical protein
MIKKTIVFGIFLTLFFVSIYSTVGKTNNKEYEKNLFLNDIFHNQGAGLKSKTAYIQGAFELECWLYSIQLNGPNFPICVCPDYPGSGCGGTFTEDGYIFTTELITGQFIEVDPETCEWDIIGGEGDNLNSLAFNPINKDIYGCSDQELYIIDRETGDQEYIGRFENSISTMIGIACDADGIIYGWDLGDNLWTINKYTGKASLVGPLGIDIENAQDGDFYQDDDILYLAAYTSSDESILYICDEDSGTCTPVGQFKDNTQVTLFAIPWNNAPIADFEWSPENPDPGENIQFDASISTDPDGDIELYEWDWDNDGEFDESTQLPTTTHTFDVEDVYPVTLQVKDEHNTKDTKTHFIKVGNRPPEKPEIDGPTRRKIGKYGTYNVTPIDPDNDEVYIRWDWGDGDVTSWKGPYMSGEEISENYLWYKKGTYTIRAQLKDIDDAESEWGEIEVKVPRTNPHHNFLLRLFERFPLIKQMFSVFR